MNLFERPPTRLERLKALQEILTENKSKPPEVQRQILTMQMLDWGLSMSTRRDYLQTLMPEYDEGTY